MKKNYIFIFIILLNSGLSAQNCNWICNGDFENPAIGPNTSGLYTSIGCWNTTATDGKMEIWGTGFNSVNSYSNGQHCELNATQAATMYQDFNVSAIGTNLTIRFAHRARCSTGQTDTMEVLMGPSGGPYTSLGKWGDGPATWGYYTSNYVVTTPGLQRIMFKPVYWGFGNAGVGNFLDAVTVCLEQSTGIVNLLDDKNLKVYPNPSSETMNFVFENSANDNYTLNIYDIRGSLVRTISEENTNVIKLNREELSGIYFYEFYSKDKTYKGKLSFVE